MKVNILDYGAIGDGITLNTLVIQKAVDDCARNLGGTVIIPQGIYLSGTIFLKSNVTLVIENGGVLKASSNIGDYEKIDYEKIKFIDNKWEKVTSLIYVKDAENVNIVGNGTIDLSGDSFMDFTRVHNNFEELNLLTLDQIQEVECKTLERPNQPIFFLNCRNVSVKDVRIMNSPCWTVSFHSSENIRIENISIVNNLRIPNSDGIHLCSCKDVIITNSNISCGDDCIAITGITNWDMPSERIIISNCILRTRSAGLRIGNLDSKIRDVIASNLIIKDSNRGIGIFADGKNGWVRSVKIARVLAETKIFAGTWWGKGEPLVLSAPNSGSVIRDVSVENLSAVSENGIIVIGEGGNIKDINIEDVTLNFRYSKY
ncbi:MAG: glycoside hydrolase family 28 protein, partial [bacterium]